jgi:hypothetical protein
MRTPQFEFPESPLAPKQPFRARADDPSGHAVWPAMRTGENTSAHAKTLPFFHHPAINPEV